jgi:hypothetical protein
VITVPQLKAGIVILQSSDAVEAYIDIFRYSPIFSILSSIFSFTNFLSHNSLWTTSFLAPFAQILQGVSPAPFIPSNFNDFVGFYNMSTNLGDLILQVLLFHLSLLL